MIDADNDAHSAWQSMRGILVGKEEYSIHSKSKFPNTGIITPTNSNFITVGIWIMPNNSDAGMLEDFIIKLINKDDTLIEEISTVLDDLQLRRNKHNNLFKEVHLAKAKICTWFSWQESPGMPLHKAIERNLITLDSDLCLRFTDWLKLLNND